MLAPMAGATIAPTLDVIRTDLNLSSTATGLIITTHGLAIAIVSPIVGWIIDRWGVRTVLTCGLVIYGIAGGSGLVIDSYVPLIASRAVFGIGAAIAFTGTTVAMLALWQGHARNRVMGWRMSAGMLGGVMFPLVGGGLATLISWHAVFVVYLVGLPLSVVAWRVLPNTRPSTGGSAGRGTGILRSAARPAALLATYALMFTLGIVMYSVAIFLPLRLAELGVTTPLLVSAYLAGLAVVGGTVGLGYGMVRRHVAPLGLLAATMVIWAVSFTTLGLSADPAVVFVATLLQGMAHALLAPTIAILVADQVPDTVLGRATAISSTLMFLGQFCSPLVLGPIMDATSIATGYLALAGLAVVVLAVLTVLRLRTGRLVAG
jgi:MFS family permease